MFDDIDVPGYIRKTKPSSQSYVDYYVSSGNGGMVSGKKYSSFADYVNDKIRCTKCGSSMMLTIYGNGRRKLSCSRSHCGTEREISLKEVEYYLSHCKKRLPLLCPKDHTILKPVVIAGHVVLQCEGTYANYSEDGKHEKIIHRYSPGSI